MRRIRLPFRLRRDTGSWFRHIEKKFTLKFDIYQLCLLAGIASQRKTDVVNEETTVLVENFPSEYKQHSRLIVALFLATEIRQLGIQPEERSQLHSEIAKLVNTHSFSLLSTVGMNEINKYSYGGFDTITEWFDEKPHTFEAFIIRYKFKLDQVLHE